MTHFLLCFLRLSDLIYVLDNIKIIKTKIQLKKAEKWKTKSSQPTFCKIYKFSHVAIDKQICFLCRPMEEVVADDSGIEHDGSSLESGDGTITPDREGSECGDRDGGATLKEVEVEDLDNELDKALDNLEYKTEPVNVMDRGGKTLVLPMPPEALVSDILRRAAYEDDVPDVDFHRFRLMYGDRVLDQGKTLAQQGVPRGSVLRLEDEMQFKVQTLDGRKLQVRARPSTTVGDFRRQLQTLTGLQPAEQRILCNGKTLADGKKLSDFKVKNGDVMQLVTRTHSG